MSSAKASPRAHMLIFLERARALVKLRAAKRHERSAATGKGGGKSAATATGPCAEAGADEAADAWDPLAMGGGDDVCECDRCERRESRRREVEAAFELGRPPMVKSKLAADGASGP